jgi:hypothetical protein
MAALKKCQDWRRSPAEATTHLPYASIGSAVSQPSIKYLNCIVTPPRGDIDLCQVQVKLHFIAFQG